MFLLHQYGDHGTHKMTMAHCKNKTLHKHNHEYTYILMILDISLKTHKYMPMCKKSQL